MFPLLNSFPNTFIAQVNGHVRFLHAVPNAPAVDIYVNNRIMSRGLSYRQFTGYMPIPGGRTTVSIYAAGSRTTPISTTVITIAPRSISTLAVSGLPSGINLLQVPEPVQRIRPGSVNVRFVNLSPNSPNVDLTLANGSILFKNVAFKGIESYIPLRAGVYNFQIRPTGTNDVILNAPNIRLLPNRFYTIYSIGITGGRPPLQILVPLDGNSYIRI